ncbi:MAG: carbohydrate-binding domain-containing protein, partial [Microvirga sp.]
MASTSSATQSTVNLSAWADVANGIGALVYLVVNGVRVGEPLYVTAGRWGGQPAQNLTFTFDTPAKVDSIAIEFANDMVDGGNRSLYIDSLKVNDVALTQNEAKFLNPWGGTENGSWNIWYNGRLTYDMTNSSDIFAPSTGGISRNGTDAAETLSGGQFDDTLNGGGGNDTFIGGAGNDRLTGGTGADVFRIAKGNGQDTITDFTASQGDLIDLIGTGLTSLDKLPITTAGTRHVISLGDGTSIAVTSSTPPQANWFKFDSGGATPPASTKSKIEFTAEAILAKNIGAHFRILVNGVEVGAGFVTEAASWGTRPGQTFSFTFDTPAKVESFSIVFDNDLTDGGDRALLIKGIKINDVALTASEATQYAYGQNAPGTFDLWYNASLNYDMTNRQDIFKPVPGVMKNGTDSADSLVGAGGPDTLNGAGGSDTLVGGDGADSLTGGAGDDLLNGGAGIDTLIGGGGDDKYVVDNVGDVVTELANEGIDTVETSVTYTLGTNVENLTLTGSTDLNGTGNALNNQIIGNTGSNLLSSGAGNDTLDGGANSSGKVDTLAGGANDDVYIVRNSS